MEGPAAGNCGVVADFGAGGGLVGMVSLGSVAASALEFATGAEVSGSGRTFVVTSGGEGAEKSGSLLGGAKSGFFEGPAWGADFELC